MLKSLFSKSPTSKPDVIFALAGALVGIYKAVDTVKQYKIDHSEEGEKK